MSKYKKLIFAVPLFLIVVFFVTNVFATPIDLSAFEKIDETVNIISGNYSTASITEDNYSAPVGLWEPDLPVPVSAVSLTFDYELVVASDNEDYFDFYFGDLSGPGFWYGGNEGLYADTITMNLRDFAGDTLPIAFVLSSGWDDSGYNSVLTISNLKINPIPVPTTLLLFSTGLIVIAGMRKKFYRL